MRLDDLVAAIRADDGAGEAVADPGLAAETRLRVMRSLETRARGRHQLVGVVTTLAILFAGTVSWALATGQVATLWSPAPPRVAPDVAPPAPPPPSPLPHRRHATAVDPTREVPRAADKAVEDPALDLASSTDPRPALPPEAVAPPAPVRPPAPPPVEALYRRAHELHFHGGDPAAALAAWDRYLAAEPDGRFAVEARYNRALVLVRLGRHAEARAALLPFARGEVVDGYRQTEAEQLVERLAHYE